MTAAVEANAADVLAYFRRRANPTEDAADLLAQTLLTVWRRVADLPTDETRARMWMFGVARRVLANYERGKIRHSDLAAKLRHTLITDSSNSDNDPADEHTDIWAAVATLPPAQRELVLLVHGDGFTVTEAASLMSASKSTTRSRYATALQSLRTVLHDYAPMATER